MFILLGLFAALSFCVSILFGAMARKGRGESNPVEDEREGGVSEEIVVRDCNFCPLGSARSEVS